VLLPHHYASNFGVPLATLGALLLGARWLDAVADPFISGAVERWFQRGVGRVLWVALAAAVVLAIGLRGLFFPPVPTGAALLVWCAALLAVSYLSYSVLTVLQQAWGGTAGRW
jgi:Na+/melibiose symporter-like transporter